MATVTHYIYSHYDPNERRKEGTSNELPDGISTTVEDESADSWESVQTFGTLDRLKRAAPRFVPASTTISDWFSPDTTTKNDKVPVNAEGDQASGNEFVGFYRNLPRRNASTPSATASSSAAVRSTPRTTSTSTTPLPPSAPSKEARTKNNWFISRAVEDEAAPRLTPSLPPSLADILARDPPPKPTEPAFTPPVFLALGPGNRGFAMLQQSGWSEGEALGAHVVRRLEKGGNVKTEVDFDGLGREVKKVKVETQEVEWDQEVQEVRRVEVVDLTLSDDEEALESFDDEVVNSEPSTGTSSAFPSTTNSESSDGVTTFEMDGRRALLTPLATVLKSDRLGIGLKAKTEGPYRASKKRVTHNAAALAAHIRAGEALKREKKAFGRGRKGFDRKSRMESQNRQDLMRALNE